MITTAKRELRYAYHSTATGYCQHILIEILPKEEFKTNLIALEDLYSMYVVQRLHSRIAF